MISSSLEKFNKAFAFSKDVWIEEKFFFEIDLLLGLNSFIKKDYADAEKYFKRMNIFSQNSFKFEDLIAQPEKMFLKMLNFIQENTSSEIDNKKFNNSLRSVQFNNLQSIRQYTFAWKQNTKVFLFFIINKKSSSKQ